MDDAVVKRKTLSCLEEPCWVANLRNLTVEYGALQEHTPKTHARPYPRNPFPVRWGSGADFLNYTCITGRCS